MKVRDLIEMDIDIDVYDDVCEELGICFCGPMKLTEAGEKKFAEVMKYPVTLRNSGGYIVAIVSVDDPEDKVWKRRLRKYVEFFEAASGYCPAEDFEKWFKEE